MPFPGKVESKTASRCKSMRNSPSFYLSYPWVQRNVPQIKTLIHRNVMYSNGNKVDPICTSTCTSRTCTRRHVNRYVTKNIPFLVLHACLVAPHDTSHARNGKGYSIYDFCFEVQLRIHDMKRYTETQLAEFKYFIVLGEYAHTQERLQLRVIPGNCVSHGIIILRNKVGFRQL